MSGNGDAGWHGDHLTLRVRYQRCRQTDPARRARPSARSPGRVLYSLLVSHSIAAAIQLLLVRPWQDARSCRAGAPPSFRPPSTRASRLRWLPAHRLPVIFPPQPLIAISRGPMATAAATSHSPASISSTSTPSSPKRSAPCATPCATWVDENLMPVIGEAYIEGKFPKELIPGMAELGLFGANLPEEYGCAGLNNVAYGLIMQELERGDSGIRSFASVQGALVMYPDLRLRLARSRSSTGCRGWPSGEEIGCFGLTEPDFGSNPGGMITTARETKDGWVLNGTKMWITNGSQATVSIVWAKTGDIDDPSRSAASSSRPTPRASPPRTRRASSRCAPRTPARSSSRTCICPRTRSCPKSGGLKSPLMCLTQARYGIAWGAIGAAMACYDEALRYAGNRVMFDKPIAADPDPAGAAGRDADRDHQGAAPGPAARPAQGRRAP